MYPDTSIWGGLTIQTPYDAAKYVSSSTSAFHTRRKYDERHRIRAPQILQRTQQCKCYVTIKLNDCSA